jgi:hypothetical protein
MIPVDERLNTDLARPLLRAESIQLYAQLSLQFVVLPDPLDNQTWVVDLRNIRHPLSYAYPTWVAAEEARQGFIHAALMEAMNGSIQSA